MVAMGACADEDANTVPGGGGANGVHRDASDLPAPNSLVLKPPAVTLWPGQEQELRVEARPAGRYLVKFALLGETLDASLDKSEDYTIPDDTIDAGVAVVTLTPPSSSSEVTGFTVRASVGTAVSAETVVTINEGALASLEVTPLYAGKRAVTSWVAAAHKGTDCTELGAGPIEGGDWISEPTAGEAAPLIEKVPVGGVTAVTLRAGFFAGGCTEVSRLIAGETNSVEVTVTDVPIRTEDTELDVMLHGDQDTVTAAWEEAIEGFISEAIDAMVAGSSNDVEALLDAMEEASTVEYDPEAYAAARAAGGWSDTVATVFSEVAADAPAETLMRSHAERWMSSGASALRDHSIEGRLAAPGNRPGEADLTLHQFWGVSQPLGRVAHADYKVSWTADPDDTVSLKATLSWTPTQLLIELAAPHAQAEVESAETAPEALAELIRCNQLGAALASNDTDSSGESGEAFEGCGADCMAQLCETAVAAIWQRAGGAVPSATLLVSSTAEATVNEYALPERFEGTWWGILSAVGGTSIGDEAIIGGEAIGSPLD